MKIEQLASQRFTNYISPTQFDKLCEKYCYGYFPSVCSDAIAHNLLQSVPGNVKKVGYVSSSIKGVHNRVYFYEP